MTLDTVHPDENSGMADDGRVFAKAVPPGFTVEYLPLDLFSAQAALRGVQFAYAAWHEKLRGTKHHLHPSWIESPIFLNLLADMMHLPRFVVQYLPKYLVNKAPNGTEFSFGVFHTVAVAFRAQIEQQYSADSMIQHCGGNEAARFAVQLALTGIVVDRDLKLLPGGATLDVAARAGAIFLESSGLRVRVRLPAVQISYLADRFPMTDTLRELAKFPLMEWTWQQFEVLQQEHLCLQLNTLHDLGRSECSFAELYPGAVGADGLFAERYRIARTEMRTELCKLLTRFTDRVVDSDAVLVEGNSSRRPDACDTVFLTPETPHWLMLGPICSRSFRAPR